MTNGSPSAFDRSTFASANVLVTGATGFIGRWVARELTGVCDELHLTVRNDGPDTRILFRDYRISGHSHSVDLSDFAAVTRLIESIKPSIVFNLAGYGVDKAETDQQAAYRINDQLVGVLAEGMAAFRNAEWPGLAVVHTGSALEYGEANGNLVETTAPKPTTQYGLSKLAGTQRLSAICGERQLPGATARLFTVYGPGEHDGRLMPALSASRTDDQPIALSRGLQKRDFTYVADVAEGLLRMAVVPDVYGDVVNLATGRLTSVREFVETVADQWGIDRRRLMFGALPTRPEEMNHDPVSIERVVEMTGWSPQTTIREGAARGDQFAESAKLQR